RQACSHRRPVWTETAVGPPQAVLSRASTSLLLIIRSNQKRLKDYCMFSQTLLSNPKNVLLVRNEPTDESVR
ncbi:MAG: hypothetical protein QW456_08025, partial [Ignisphaera sp.]